MDPTFPQDIACLAKGAWFGTGSLTQPLIDDVVTRYLEFYPLSSAVGGGGVVTWTGVAQDVLSQRSVVTGCLPLYQDRSADDAPYGSADDAYDENADDASDENADDAPTSSADDAPHLLGVVCIDVDVEMVPGLVEVRGRG